MHITKSDLYESWNIVFILISAPSLINGNIRVAERLALPTSDHGVTGSNPAGGEILPEPKRRFIAQSLSCSPFHRLEMTEILLKGRKTLTHHPSSLINAPSSFFMGNKSVKIPLTIGFTP